MRKDDREKTKAIAHQIMKEHGFDNLAIIYDSRYPTDVSKWQMHTDRSSDYKLVTWVEKSLKRDRDGCVRCKECGHFPCLCTYERDSYKGRENYKVSKHVIWNAHCMNCDNAVFALPNIGIRSRREAQKRWNTLNTSPNCGKLVVKIRNLVKPKPDMSKELIDLLKKTRPASEVLEKLL